MLQYLENEKGFSPIEAKATVDVLDHAGLQSMAVCSGAGTGESNKKCQYPDIRLLDGGYTDDSGIALLVGHLQTKFGVNIPIKIMALDSDGCSMGSTAAACKEGVEYEAEWLFQQDKKRTYNGINLPSKTIFDTKWDSSLFKDMYGNSISLYKASAGSTASAERVTYHLGTYTTVENKVFGVQAGSSVELMLINVNSMTDMILVDEGAANTAKYTKLAEDMYTATQEAVRKYFQ